MNAKLAKGMCKNKSNNVITLLFAILVVIQTVHALKLDDNTRIRRQACGLHQFQCSSGKCIHDDNLCDGMAQCDDQSDEKSETCSKHVCPAFTFKCAYGACVNARSLCNGVKDCFDGSDEDPRICSDRRPASEVRDLQCSPQKNTTSTKVTCTKNGAVADCEKPTTGTSAKFWCTDYYEDLSLIETNSFSECIDGNWDRAPPSCKPVCGKKSVQAERLRRSVGGTISRKGDYPWQVALYRKTGNTTKQLICGGTLINERMVLTAAVCVTDPSTNNDLVPKEKYVIAVGKYYRKYDDSRDDVAQFSTLEAIYVPRKFKGSALNYQADIAILVASASFHFSRWVQPVCVDRKHTLNDTILKGNNEGYIAGWGFTNEDSAPSEVLRSIEVPHVEADACKRQLPLDFTPFLTDDKFCAGFANQGTAICKGDSGGGLVFRNSYDGRHYIQGIASVAPRSKTNVLGCDSQNYALYTDVRKYIDFILDKEQQHQKDLL